MKPKIIGIDAHSALGLHTYWVGSPAYTHPNCPMITEIVEQPASERYKGISPIIIFGQDYAMIAELIGIPVEIYYELPEKED